MSPRPKLFQCDEDESYCKFGIERLTNQLEAFENQISGVMKSEDIEYVHRMRVASRRIRATMPLFSNCFPLKKFKRWLKQIKRVTRLLGEARDLDVQIAFIKEYQSKIEGSKNNPAMELLLNSHEKKRARVQPDVLKGLEKIRVSGTLTQMKEFLEWARQNLQNPNSNSVFMMERARWPIYSRLDNFLAMEPYVHQEGAILKHHEMRIRAKWLRYTIETFSPLYSNKLEKEIETTKSFQDVLGEMHDCDVWIEYIPRFITELETLQHQTEIKTERAKEEPLASFLDYVKKQRKIHYSHFVELWENNKKTNLFENLKETINNGLPKPQDKIEELWKNPKLEVAVLADIHANLHALQAVIEDAEKRGINVFLNAGDLIGFGAFPNEVIELVQSKNFITVVGNYDLEVIENVSTGKKESKIALEFAIKQLTCSCKAYLSSLPREIRIEIYGKNILLTHGSPESIDEHLYHDTPVKRLKEIAEVSRSNLILTGHAHEQYTRELNGTCFVNPGSVGRPGDENPQAAYAVMRIDPFSIELLRVNYNVAAAAEALRRKGLPESFSQMLLRGVALERISKEDDQRRKTLAENCQRATKNCQETSKQYRQDEEHYEQVRKLSLFLFDRLQGLHKLGNTERCWLECAAILHDVGISKTVKAHNKKSMELILDDARLLLPSMERRIIASIARYHRKGFPRKKNYNLLPLSSKVIKKITLLSAILRVGDSLDYTHNAIVEDLKMSISPKRITIECVTSRDPSMEQRAFAKKKDLIEKILKRDMVLIWKKRQK